MVNHRKIFAGATGAIKPAYGVLGMAGVGKTVALQGLAHDEDVKKRFDGGVLYMRFGRDATVALAIQEISKIMALTGATTTAEKAKSATSIADAVDFAVTWFKGKVCLYLVDDLWPAENLPWGYFHDLCQLVRGCERSRMAISTRSLSIAKKAGCPVKFDIREPQGRASIDIFMAHACGDSTGPSSFAGVDGLRSSLSKILGICGGLPIALSVIGHSVCKGVVHYGTFERACDAYAAKLEKRRELVGEKEAEGGTSLNAGIELSLESIEPEFSQCVAEYSLETDHTVSDLYISLCVLPEQMWIPVSFFGSNVAVLKRMLQWMLRHCFCDMSLAKLEWQSVSSESRAEPGIVVHDLLLDFCRRRAEAGKKLGILA